MFELFTNLWTMLQTAGPESVIKALIVFVSIFVLRWLTIIPDSKWSRMANVIFSLALSGAMSSGVKQEEVLIFSMTSALSAGIWEVCKLAYDFIEGKVSKFSLSK